MENIMENIMVKKLANTYAVIADTERFGKGEILFESFAFGECIDWLTANNVYMWDVDINAPEEIASIELKSFLSDLFKINYKNGFTQRKQGWSSLNDTEKAFMDSHKSTSSRIPHYGGLHLVYA